MTYLDTSKKLRSDSLFLACLRDGDEDAFNLLMNTYGGALIGHASRIVNSVDSAREVVQEVFLEVWRGREHIEPTWDIVAYLYGLTRRRSMDVARAESAARHREYKWVKEVLEPTWDEADDADEADGNARVRASLWNALTRLSPRCREVFMLVWDRQLSYLEIAQHLGISEPTVRGHMSRAVQHLASELGPGSKDNSFPK